MERQLARLDTIGEALRERLTAKHAARERALPQCREAIRHCANSIRATHRSEFAQAQVLLEMARSALSQVRRGLEGHGDIYHAGFLHDAEKEYAEAAITLALVAGEVLPSPQELEVADAAYLNGLGEVVGELRRYLLDRLRQGEVSSSERILLAMEEFYHLLVTMDFPEAITGGLRRTTDSVRGILERTRGDLTLAMGLEGLERRLEEFRAGTEGNVRRGGRRKA